MLITQKFHSQIRCLILLLPIFFVYAPIVSYDCTKLTVLTKRMGARGAPLGVPSVTRSLLAGLGALHMNFNYNPASEYNCGDTIIVLADIHALQQAIALKKRGFIKCLLAGPNLVVWPTDDHGLITSPEIDAVIVPSEPTRHMYVEISPEIEDRTYIWFAGVDTHFWQPPRSTKQNNVLIYWKNKAEGPALKNEVIALLNRYHWNPITLEYGKYRHDHFRKLLANASFSVFLSRSESQGIALAEAWSMNVPTLAWNPKERFFRGREYSMVSSCPYLTQQTGFDWKTIGELEAILQKSYVWLHSSNPRRWVLEHMTDNISAQALLQIIASLPNNI